MKIKIEVNKNQIHSPEKEEPNYQKTENSSNLVRKSKNKMQLKNKYL